MHLQALTFSDPSSCAANDQLFLSSFQIGTKLHILAPFPFPKRTTAWSFPWFCSTSHPPTSPSLASEQSRPQSCPRPTAQCSRPRPCLRGTSTSSSSGKMPQRPRSCGSCGLPSLLSAPWPRRWHSRYPPFTDYGMLFKLYGMVIFSGLIFIWQILLIFFIDMSLNILSFFR